MKRKSSNNKKLKFFLVVVVGVIVGVSFRHVFALSTHQRLFHFTESTVCVGGRKKFFFSGLAHCVYTKTQKPRRRNITFENPMSLPLQSYKLTI